MKLEIINESDSPELRKCKEDINRSILLMESRKNEEESFSKDRERINNIILKSSILSKEEKEESGDNILKDSIERILLFNPSLHLSLSSFLGGLSKKVRGRRRKEESVPCIPIDLKVIKRFEELRIPKDPKNPLKGLVGVYSISKKIVSEFDKRKLSEEDIECVIQSLYNHLNSLEKGKKFQDIPNRKDKWVDSKNVERKLVNPIYHFDQKNPRESDQDYSKRLRGMKVSEKRIQSLLESSK